MNTWINHLPGLVSCLTAHGYVDTRFHAKFFDNGYEYKKDFTPLIKEFNIKPVLTPVKNPQANATSEQVHQVILNMIDTKDLDNKVFDHIDPWGETLAYIAWAIRDSYQRTIMAKPGQAVFGRDMLYNFTSVLYWRVVTDVKQ